MEGVAAWPRKGGTRLGKSLCCGEKGSLVACQEAEEAQSCLCSEGSR